VAAVDKRNFTRGIFSPVVQARKDVDAWAAGAKRLTNVTLLKHGGVRKRPGTWFVYRLPAADDETRLLPFTYSTGQSYALLMGQATMKPLALGGAVLSDGYGITAITQANPGVITAPYHGLTTGDEIYLSGISGMTELNGKVVTVTVIDPDNFSIGIDTTGYSAFTADDGTVRAAPAPSPAPAPAVPAPTPAPTPPVTIPPYQCPEWDTGILMANAGRTGAGTVKPARLVVVGDYVWTRHAATGAWGAYRVVGSSFHERPVYSNSAVFFRASERHRFDVSRRGLPIWQRIEDGGTPAGTAMVWQATIESAETYVCVSPEGRQVLSHNRKSTDPAT
jgi:hypothetical protein